MNLYHQTQSLFNCGTSIVHWIMNNIDHIILHWKEPSYEYTFTLMGRTAETPEIEFHYCHITIIIVVGWWMCNEHNAERWKLTHEVLLPLQSFSWREFTVCDGIDVFQLRRISSHFAVLLYTDRRVFVYKYIIIVLLLFCNKI